MLSDFVITPHKNVVAGVGSALVDICLLESESFARASGAQIGGMTLVDAATTASVLAKSAHEPQIVPGGSACNTILGIGMLGGKARFIGKRGNDEYGRMFEAGLIKHHVEPRLFTTDTPTGTVLSIITPDAQRSMLTFLGASAETDPAEITASLFENACLVHLEGYLLFNKDLMTAVLRAAEAAGTKISLDLASYTVVEQSLDFLTSIIEEYIDIVIANEDESRVYTGYDDERSAVQALARVAEIAVVKMGGRGSLIAHNGTVTAIKPLSGGRIIDTTGAGDLWAAGFLFGITHGYTIEQSGDLGSACGYEVCQVVGATIPDDGWQRIKARM